MINHKDRILEMAARMCAKQAEMFAKLKTQDKTLKTEHASFEKVSKPLAK